MLWISVRRSSHCEASLSARYSRLDSVFLIGTHQVIISRPATAAPTNSSPPSQIHHVPNPTAAHCFWTRRYSANSTSSHSSQPSHWKSGLITKLGTAATKEILPSHGVTSASFVIKTTPLHLPTSCINCACLPAAERAQNHERVPVILLLSTAWLSAKAKNDEN